MKYDKSIFLQSWLFQIHHLYENDILFREGEKNSCIYFIISGEVVIEKSVITFQWKFKALSHLGENNIIGEGALSWKYEKQVQIRSTKETELFSIDAKDFPKFVQAYPKQGYEILLSIIELSNTRLLRANREITATYEVNVAISKIKDFSTTSLYKLLLVFESILEVDQIMYFEKNLALDTYFKLKYDSKSEKGIQNKIFKFDGNTLDLENIKNQWFQISKYFRFAPLKLGEVNYGFLLIGKEKWDFWENEEKLLINTAWSFVAVIHQKKVMDEEKNKFHVKNYNEEEI